MNTRHKIIREMLKQLPLPEAERILKENLLDVEYQSIFFSRDVANRYDMNGLARKLSTSDRNIKRYRKAGYEKLAFLFFRN